MTHDRTAVRWQMVLGLLFTGLLLVVLGAVLATVGGAFAVTGVAGGGVAAALLALLGRARVDPPVTVGTARLVAAQPVMLAAAVTGAAVAVASPAGDAARIAGGALAALAVTLDGLVVTSWWQDRPRRR